MFLAGVLAAAAVPARAGEPLMRLGGPAFGSAWTVTLPRRPGAEAVSAVVARVVEEVDESMSPWRDDSEISRLNAAAAGEVAVSPGLHEVATRALAVSGASGGAFDPSVGPLVRRFGWGPIRGGAGASDSMSLTSTGIRKSRSDATLDLCGIAKGHALDRAVDALAALGLRDALVEMGGEVRALGRHPTGRAWQVAVETPAPGPLAVQRIVAPGPLALATSATVPQGYDVGGRRTSHIIDPRSGRPVPGLLAQVTVAAESAAFADAWATALLVLGPEKGPETAQRNGVAALFLTRDGAEIMNPEFADIVVV